MRRGLLRDREALLVIGVAFLALVGFLGKPFHLDDALFLRMARQIQDAPTRPFDFLYNWSLSPVPAWLVYLNPPLNSYWLAFVGLWAREGEAATHLAYLPFSLACAGLMLAIARKLCRRPVWPVLATVLCPAFLVSATNVMADVPLLAFWLLAVWAALKAVETRRGAWMWAAGAAAALAAMTKYFGLALAPLLAALWLLKTRRSTKHLAALALPFLAAGLWGGYSLGQAGFFHPLGSAAFGMESRRTHLSSLSTAGVFLAGCLVWPLPVVPSLFQRRRRRIDADTVWLSLWLLGTLFFSACLNWTVNARTILPAAFPAALLAARRLESEKGWILYAALAPTALLSLLLAVADQGMAAAARDFAREVARPLVKKGDPVFFIGHWGLQHYMEKEGAVAFDYKVPELPSGAWVLVSLNNTGAVALPESLSAAMETQSIRRIENPYGLQTMDVEGGKAGFYSSMFGAVPFAFGRGLYYDTWIVQRYAPKGARKIN